MDPSEQKPLPAPAEPAAPPPPPPPKRHISLWKILLGAIGLLLLLFVLLVVGYLPRQRRQRAAEAAAEREANALPVVNVMRVMRAPNISNLQLPGTTAPLTEAYIYSRATGYVRRRFVDIGDRVRKGQLIAEIDAPDIDAQVTQARATLSQAEKQLAQAHAALENAQAQEDLARVTWERYRVLVAHGAVSRQDADTQLAGFRESEANTRLQAAGIRAAEDNVRANRGNLEHLLVLQSFDQITAPFAGIITARNFDIGAYVAASGASLGLSGTPMGGTQLPSTTGNSGPSGVSTTPPPQTSPTPATPGIGNAGELYRMAAITTVRVLVNVPQGNAPFVRVGQGATVLVQEFPGHPFNGKVTRTTNSYDPGGRTLVTEVDVANPAGLLVPGMYTRVQLRQDRSQPPLIIPGEAIITTPSALEVAVLMPPTAEQLQVLQRKQDELRVYTKGSASRSAGDPGDVNQARRVHIQPVTVGRDYGPVIEITSGLQGWEYIVVNPTDEIQEGALIMPRTATLPGEANLLQPPQSERTPSGIAAPSLQAPTQGAPTAPRRPARAGGPVNPTKGGEK